MARPMRATSAKIGSMGKECGLTRLVYPSGKRYEGEFQNDQPHGHGKLYGSKAEAIEGIWRQGRFLKRIDD